MILCIVGPTGVGKTKLSIELAKKYNAIIINADSTILTTSYIQSHKLSCGGFCKH